MAKCYKKQRKATGSKKRNNHFVWGGMSSKKAVYFVVVDILFQKNNLSETTLPKTNMVILNKLW